MPVLTEAQRRKFGDNARCLLHKVVIAPIFVLQGEKSSRFGLDKDTASSGRNRPNRGEGVCWRVSKGLLKVGVWLVWVFFCACACCSICQGPVVGRFLCNPSAVPYTILMLAISIRHTTALIVV